MLILSRALLVKGALHGFDIKALSNRRNDELKANPWLKSIRVLSYKKSLSSIVSIIALDSQIYFTSTEVILQMFGIYLRLIEPPLLPKIESFLIQLIFEKVKQTDNDNIIIIFC